MGIYTAELRAFAPNGDPWLLTPGPLTTSTTVKEAMLHDYGSRDPTFIQINREIREELLSLVAGEKTHVVVPLQGSGTFAVEAMLRTLVSKEEKVLILINGVYGKRMKEICSLIPRNYTALEFGEVEPIDIERVRRALKEDLGITHVAAVYCETTTGILNPIRELSAVVQEEGRKFLIDAMSAFGALPLDLTELQVDAIAASSNKCLQGVAGVGFCIANRTSLEKCSGNAGSLSLDLFSQVKEMERSGQWRFTPPTQVLLALHQALKELKEEGGIEARRKRYSENCRLLRAGMVELGFQPLLKEEHQAPIIITFLMPQNSLFQFTRFYEELKKRGFLIYPGKLTEKETFRMGCIGQISPKEIEEALDAIRSILNQ